MTDPQLQVLHALRIRGLASEAVLAVVTGLAVEEVQDLLAAMATTGLVARRGGRMPGFTLTAQGTATHVSRLAEDMSTDTRQQVEQAYGRFLPVNTAFKHLCTSWQLRLMPDGSEVPNDHTDAVYDAVVVERLAALHGDVVRVVADVVAELPRFATYDPRFTAALRRVQDGDRSAFSRPLSDSYHDIWMELHEDFLLSLGRTRGEADGH